MPTQAANLVLLEDLEDVGRTSELADEDLAALRAVADWIETFAVKPRKDLGRARLVRPFVPGALERKAFRLAPSRSPSFRPFQSPVPFLFVRHGVVSDWKFFLGNEEWLAFWARRSGESAVHALAEELRHLPARAGPLAQAVIDVGAN